MHRSDLSSQPFGIAGLALIRVGFAASLHELSSMPRFYTRLLYCVGLLQIIVFWFIMLSPMPCLKSLGQRGASSEILVTFEKDPWKHKALDVAGAQKTGSLPTGRVGSICSILTSVRDMSGPFGPKASRIHVIFVATMQPSLKFSIKQPRL